MNASKQAFLDSERRSLLSQLSDLQTSLEINKAIICDLLQAKGFSKAFEQAITAKCIDEVTLLTARIKQQQREIDEMQGRMLVTEQLACEAAGKACEEMRMCEEQIAEMKDKLDRKEFFMQNKERKWIEIERILEEYVHDDDELRDRLLELRVNVSAASTKKISNVVHENDQLKVELDNAHEEIARMRKQLLTVGTRKEPQIDNAVLDNIVGEMDEYDEEDEEEEEDTKSQGDAEKKVKIIAEKFTNHKSNKKSFMSTAPLSAFIPKQPQGHHLGSLKQKLKVKETKVELRQYS